MSEIILKNDFARVLIDPDRGGQITSFTTGDERDLIFAADWSAPLSADDGPVYGSTELDWLSRYGGGWQTLFPNAGAAGVVDGVPVAFHGETSLARVRVISAASDRCEIEAPARLPLVLRSSIRLAADRAALLIDHTVTNVGSRRTPYLLGHHPTFPAIPGSSLDAPGGRVEVEPATPGPLRPGSSNWPVAPRADGDGEDLSVIPGAEQVRLIYRPDIPEGWAALRPPETVGGKGAALAWDVETFPHLWIWLQNAHPGFPWYGRARMIGIEPQRSWPFDGIEGAIARDQALWLEPGEARSAWVTLAAFDDVTRPVVSVSRAGHVLQLTPDEGSNS